MKSTENSISVFWNSNNTETMTGYQIEYSTNKYFSGKTVQITKSSTDQKRAITNLQSGKTYYVHLRQFKTVDGKKYFSNWSARQAITTK